LQRKLLSALIKARLYGGSALILGVDQGDFTEDHTLPLDKIGLAIDLTDAAVCMDYALRGGDALSIAGALERLRKLNEGLAGGRAPAGG
jgi:hypothetical protein